MREGSVATCNSSAFVISDETPFYSWLTRSAAKQPSHPLSRLVRRSRFLSLFFFFFSSPVTVYPSCIFKLTDPWKFVAGSSRYDTDSSPPPLSRPRFDSSVGSRVERSDDHSIDFDVAGKKFEGFKTEYWSFYGFCILGFCDFMRGYRRFGFIMSRLGDNFGVI